jgi:hypothetical protein
VPNRPRSCPLGTQTSCRPRLGAKSTSQLPADRQPTPYLQHRDDAIRLGSHTTLKNAGVAPTRCTVHHGLAGERREQRTFAYCIVDPPDKDVGGLSPPHPTAPWLAVTEIHTGR